MSIARLMQMARAGVPAGGGVVEGWDVSTAVFVQRFSVAAREATPTGVFFKPDGLKMYVIGHNNDRVNEYTLSTAWNISTAVFAQRFSVAAQEAVPHGIFFKPDGLKMYVSGYGSDSVNEYNLSTAWNISTAVFVQSKSVIAQDTASTSVFFRPDGIKMYVIGYGSDNVNEYTLSTAWNVSTAVFAQSFSVAAQEGVPIGLFFKPDGLKMYVTGVLGDDVNEYTLSTAWNISTSVYLQSFSVAAQETTPTGVFFKPDGLKMYVAGIVGQDVNEYDLTT